MQRTAHGVHSTKTQSILQPGLVTDIRRGSNRGLESQISPPQNEISHMSPCSTKLILFWNTQQGESGVRAALSVAGEPFLFTWSRNFLSLNGIERKGKQETNPKPIPNAELTVWTLPSPNHFSLIAKQESMPPSFCNQMTWTLSGLRLRDSLRPGQPASEAPFNNQPTGLGF